MRLLQSKFTLTPHSKFLFQTCDDDFEDFSSTTPCPGHFDEIESFLENSGEIVSTQKHFNEQGISSSSQNQPRNLEVRWLPSLKMPNPTTSRVNSV
jgi:hypothetical protein